MGGNGESHASNQYRDPSRGLEPATRQDPRLDWAKLMFLPGRAPGRRSQKAGRIRLPVW